jgi:hypothetical protein
MRWIWLLLGVSLIASGLAQAPKPNSIRGVLRQRPGQLPVLETADHRAITLDGDESTKSVLNDARLAGFDLEAKGHFTAPDRFLIDPFHTEAIFVRKDGHLKVITYWCDTCSIRSYTPGPCVCCQKETTLDLRDPDQDRQ